MVASVHNLVLGHVLRERSAPFTNTHTHTKNSRSHSLTLALGGFAALLHKSSFLTAPLSTATEEGKREREALTGTSTTSNRHLLTCWALLGTKQLHSVHTLLAWANSEENNTDREGWRD